MYKRQLLPPTTLNVQIVQPRKRKMQTLRVAVLYFRDRDRLGTGAASVVFDAEDNLHGLRSYVDSLHECPNNLSSSTPVNAWQVWPNGYCQLAQAIPCRHDGFQIIDSACIMLILPSRSATRLLVCTIPDVNWFLSISAPFGDAVDQPV